MPNYLPSSRYRVAALGLLAATAAVSLILAALTPAIAAPTRAAATGFGRAVEIIPPRNSATDIDSILIGVACTGRGYCSAGGEYTDSDGNSQAMVVTEAHGVWGRGVEVRLPANAASNPEAEVNGVACTSRGNCVAVGYYRPAVGDDSGFIVTQHHGAWGHAVAAAPLPKGVTGSWLYAVACPAAGSCEAVGDYYVQKSMVDVGVVIAEVHGRWTREHSLRAPTGQGPDMSGIACTRAGDCVADGFYFPTGSANVYSAVGYVQSRGKWGGAATVRAPKNKIGKQADLASAACMPDGSCLGAGGYTVGSSGRPMATAESGGKWRAAAEISALPSHATGAYVDGVSCASVRLCVAAGGYSTSSSLNLAYLVSFVSGRWRDAGGVSLPTNALSPAHSFIYAVGCASDGYCAAAGYYYYFLSGDTGRSYPMVATRS